MWKHTIHGSNSRIFTRGIRTRTPIKIKLNTTQQQQKTENLTQPPPQPPTPSITKRSKFSTNPTSTTTTSGINEILQKLNFKQPKEIEAELIEKFKHDGMEVDKEFIQNMINESIKEQETLKNYITDPSNTINNVNTQEINRYIDWIITDGTEKLKTQKIDKFKEKVKLRNKLNDFLLNPDHEQSMDPEPLTNAFATVQQLNELNSDVSSSLDHLPILLKELNKFKNTEILESISIDKISSLYQISTQIINLQTREKCIYLCGKLLYKALVKEYGPRARPDIINEKFYIESCIKFNDLKTASQLYTSRLEKDVNVQNQRFWYELGISINISQYSEFNDLQHLDHSIDLVNEIRSKWGYVNNLSLIDCLKRCCLKGNFEDALWFWDEIKLNLAEFGIVEKIKVPETKLYGDNEIDKVFNYYNRIEPIFYDGLIECIFPFLSGKKFNEAMEILNHVYQFDHQFIYYFVENFGKNFRYSGRELFLIYLENNKADELNTFLIDELKPLQNIRCASIEEANIIEEINVYLERLTKLKSKNLSKIKDLHEIIQSGERLGSFDVKAIIKILLQHKSTTSYTLACKIIYQMNDHKLNNINDSILPISTSHIYTEFFQQFLSQSNPRINEINKFLNLMIQYDIKLDQKLANKIIISYINKKLFSEAIKFIETFIFSDNPISVQEIKISKSDSNNLYTAIFLAYYRSISTGMLEKKVTNLRSSSLRYYIRKMMDNKIDNNFTIQESIGALLAYGDYDGLICLIQWYGLNIGDIKFDLVLAIKTKLELSILKAEKYLKLNSTNHNHHPYENKIETYRLNFGIQSLQNDLKIKRDFAWQEVALVVYNYADLFGYKSSFSKDDPFSMLIPDVERVKNRQNFEAALEKSQDYFDLPHWNP